MDIKGKVVLITGSSSGIGKTTALRFAKEGAKVVVNYRVNMAGAEGTLKKIKELKAEGMLVQADITNEDDIKRMIDTVVKKFKTIDILINNGAIPNDQVPYFEASGIQTYKANGIG